MGVYIIAYIIALLTLHFTLAYAQIGWKSDDEWADFNQCCGTKPQLRRTTNGGACPGVVRVAGVGASYNLNDDFEKCESGGGVCVKSVGGSNVDWGEYLQGMEGKRLALHTRGGQINDVGDFEDLSAFDELCNDGNVGNHEDCKGFLLSGGDILTFGPWKYRMTVPGTNWPQCVDDCTQDGYEAHDTMGQWGNWCVPKENSEKKSIQFLIHHKCDDVADLCGWMFGKRDANDQPDVRVQYHFNKLTYIVSAFLGVIPKVDFEPLYLWWSDQDQSYDLEYFTLKWILPIAGNRQLSYNESISIDNRRLGGILSDAKWHQPTTDNDSNSVSVPKHDQGPFHFYASIRVESKRVTLPIDVDALEQAVTYADTWINNFESGPSDGTTIFNQEFEPIYKFDGYPENYNPWYEPLEQKEDCQWNLGKFIDTKWIGLCHVDVNFHDCVMVREDSRSSIFDVECQKCLNDDVCLAGHSSTRGGSTSSNGWRNLKSKFRANFGPARA